MNKFTWLERLQSKIRPKLKMLTIIFVIITLPLIYWLVYATGGIKYVFSHTMYIPILVAGFILGRKWGIAVALVASILLGPLMPIDTTSMEPQLPINYLYRAGIFLLIGFLSGFWSDILRKQVTLITQLYSINIETKIPNPNVLYDFTKNLTEPKDLLLMSILLNNANNIVDVMGISLFYRLMYEIYRNLQEAIGDAGVVVQSGVSKYWILKSYNDVYIDRDIILNVLSTPVKIDNVPFYVEFSVGASALLKSQNLKDLEVFAASDSSARFAQVNNLPFALYDESIFKKRKDFELLGTFLEALNSNQLYLVYQPKINLSDNTPCGLEALIRWQHPSKGLIMPDNFIPLIEETKLIHNLTAFVIESALDTIEAFLEKGIEVPISINISAKNFYDKNFIKNMITSTLQRGINPSLLEIEITETALMSNPEDSKAYLTQVYNSGIKISLDDYGTGYSSLAYLSSFPLHILKIDKVFIAKIDDKSSVHQIVKSTIDLAHQLGYQVIAEGVETEKNVITLKELGCEIAQGYYFSRPIPFDEIMKWYLKKSSPQG